MPVLSITAAWNEAEAFVRQEARLLFPIAFMLIALPAGLLQFIMPVPVPGQPPSAGAWLLFFPVAAVLGIVGTLALTHLALSRGASVAEALQLGLRRFIVVLAASLLIFVGFAVAAFPVLLVLVLAAGGGAQPNPAIVQILPLIVIVPALALWARLMLITPATAAEAAGPIAVIRRSWELTRGHFWKLFGLLVLVLLVLGVVTGVGAFVGGLLVILIAGQPEPGSLPALLVILISVALHTLITVYVAPLHARIYRQLAGGDRHDIFA